MKPIKYYTSGKESEVQLSISGLTESAWKRIVTLIDEVAQRTEGEVEETCDVLLLYVSRDDAKNRLRMRTERNNASGRVVIVSEQTSLALFAWQIGADKFMLGPLTKERIGDLVGYLTNLPGLHPKLGRYAIKASDGRKIFVGSQLALVKGEGEASLVQLIDGTTHIVKKRLKYVAPRFKQVLGLKQISRSLYVNLSVLTSVVLQPSRGRFILTFKGGQHRYAVSLRNGRKLLKRYITGL